MKTNKNWHIILLAALMAISLIALSANFTLASTLLYSQMWEGQGSDSLDCDKLGESPERTADGWIHWIVTQGSDVTEAELVLGGSGNGTYEPSKYGPVVEFFTPYFDIDTLTATLYFDGSLSTNTQFVISDYCPGTLAEHLIISKTAVTSYTRTHEWDIEKEVETEKKHTVDEDTPKIWLYTDGSGNETATWNVDVIYKGHEDGNFNVSGEITIENMGAVDALITGVVDELAGTPVTITWPEGTEFPYTLAVEDTLTGTYSENVDGKTEGINVVTVTTERDSYSGDAVITWGDPEEELYQTVNIKDISDLFGEVDLGMVAAPNDAQFDYSKAFAWADYGAAGSFTYDNTATIDETNQSADAVLKVNVQGFFYETAYAKGDTAQTFSPTFRNWGWTNPILPGNYEMELWAGAGKNDTSKGTLVGFVTIIYGGNGYVTGTYNLYPGFSLDETHFYAGKTKFPQMQQGRRIVNTVAPGQYYNDSPFDGNQVYVIAHAVVGLPNPNFGPTE